MNPAMIQQQQQRMVLENAKRELRALTQQRNIAEQGIVILTNVAAELGCVERDSTPNDIYTILAAVTALCSIRLLELQINCENASERIPKLEAFISQAESGIAVPGLAI